MVVLPLILIFRRVNDMLVFVVLMFQSKSSHDILLIFEYKYLEIQIIATFDIHN